MPAQLTRPLDRARPAPSSGFTTGQRTLAHHRRRRPGARRDLPVAAWLAQADAHARCSPTSSGADASAIVEQLDARRRHVRARRRRLHHHGARRRRCTSERLKLAAAGLPADADGGGYSLLDEQGITASEFQQQVTYQRALEGELAKTIGAIDGVETATVHLAIPEETVFADEKADPTASVFVRTGARRHARRRPGAGDRPPRLRQHRGPEADRRHRHRLQRHGALRRRRRRDAAPASPTSRPPTTSSASTAAVQTMLDRVVGPGNAAVTVTADLNYDETPTTTEETFTRRRTPRRWQSSTKTEEYTGTGGGADAACSARTTSRSRRRRRRPAAYKSTTEDARPTPSTRSPRSPRPPRAASSASRSPSPSTPTPPRGIDMADLEALVAAAAGIDATRGDTVEVAAMAVRHHAAQAAEEALAAADAAAKAEAQNELIEQGAIGGGILRRPDHRAHRHRDRSPRQPQGPSHARSTWASCSVHERRRRRPRWRSRPPTSTRSRRCRPRRCRSRPTRSPSSAPRSAPSPTTSPTRSPTSCAAGSTGSRADARR